MEEELQDCEFWLPPDFLTDDDFKLDGDDGVKSSGNGSGSSISNFSGLSSPVESVIDSVETGKEEDDYISELTRKMVQATLDDEEANNTRKLSGSPNSPLCKRGSNRFTLSGGGPQESGRNLMHASPGEVSRMKMVEESSIGLFPSRIRPDVPFTRPGPVELRHVAPINKPGPLAAPVGMTGFNTNQTHLSYEQFQAAWYDKLAREQMKKQQEVVNDLYAPQGNSSNWPTLQQAQQLLRPPPQPNRGGSGMRAVYLGNSGVRKERTGTGVFLPRRDGYSTPARRNKPGCSVLLPERVVLALNLNLEPITPQPQPQVHSGYNPNFTVVYDMNQQRQASMIMRPQQGMMMNNQEFRLPQDWTY